MSHDLTLPGDIPGLLRRGSPVVHPRSSVQGVYDSIKDHGWIVMRRVRAYIELEDEWSPGPGYSAADGGDCGWHLDLTDPTGRVHAAWWCRRRDPSVGGDRCIQSAIRGGAGMPETEIAALRDLVLRLAGRAP